MIERFLVELIRTALKSGLRGRTRLTMFLARHFSKLQAVPVERYCGRSIYLDLRLVATHDVLIGRSGEAGEQEAMRKAVESGMVAYDIGANIGLHTVLLSCLTGPDGVVVAFEPQMQVLRALETTVRSSENTILVTCALSDKNGTSKFFVAPEASMSSLTDWTGRGSSDEVKTRRLDDVVSEMKLALPDFIKCDIEGGELACFRGAEMTIRDSTPVIMFEANRNAAASFGEKANSAMAFLDELNLGYRFFEIGNEGGISEISAEKDDFVVHRDFSNLLAIPPKQQNRINEF